MPLSLFYAQVVGAVAGGHRYSSIQSLVIHLRFFAPEWQSLHTPNVPSSSMVRVDGGGDGRRIRGLPRRVNPKQNPLQPHVVPARTAKTVLTFGCTRSRNPSGRLLLANGRPSVQLLIISSLLFGHDIKIEVIVSCCSRTEVVVTFCSRSESRRRS